MLDSLGAWSNAPLAYALAEVRTERLADIKNYQPNIAGKLRENYPIQKTMHATRLVATGAQIIVEADQDTAWEFATPDNKVAVILRPNGLVLHATAYEDSATFLKQLDDVVDVVASEVPAVYVNRLGLRYIDFVLPSSGEEPEAYVDRRLNPALQLLDSKEEVNATSLAVYRMKSGETLSLRYIRARGKPELPPDLGMLSLDPSRLMLPGIVKDSQPTALLDIDCNFTYTPVVRLDPTRAKEQFRLIYKISFNAFTSAITEHAKTVWGAKT
jgi:uncharacterized protein (TIGR04255 family)